MQDDLVNDLENQALRKGPRAAPLADGHEPQGPSFAKVALWIGLGCFTFVSIMGIIVAVGLNALWTIVKDYSDTEARNEAAEVAAYSEFVTFKPGDPVPEPPLELPKPSPPASRLGKADLTEVDGRRLASAAYGFYLKREYQAAVQCQYQSVVKMQTGQYNLACFYARAGDVPAALYWLQVSAKDEGANAQWASQDEDLIAVRKNPRWPILLNYLTAFQSQWEKSGLSETTLVLPRNATAGQPLPVFIGLHGMGANAHNFIDAEMYQPLADEIGVAFLGVSGTLSRGKESFVWSEDPVRDLARIDAALQEVAGKLAPAEGKLVLFGFSQGGSVAAELAARHPTRFAGAILLSPGADSETQAKQWQGQPENKRQGIVAVCGAGENPSTVDRTNQYAAVFKLLGARVSLKIYPGMNTHSLPPDYTQQFPVWGQFILNPDARVFETGQ